MSEYRAAVLEAVAREVTSLPGNSIVAVDGVDGSGKTMFADEVASLVSSKRAVARASVDGFHRPAAERYERGRQSPEGFLRDSYDYDAFVERLLKPFAEGRPFVDVVHDVETDQFIEPAPVTPEADQILIVDGIFLHRPELRNWWSWSVFLRAPFEVTIRRCADRDGSDPDPSAERNHRYVEGQCIYLSECDPEGQATIVIDNSDLAHPIIVRSEV